MTLRPAYVGPDHLEARFAEQRAQEAGLSALRSKVVGHISSFRDGWVFRKKLAAAVRCSVRTVQRAITQAREEGLLGVARAKKAEIPPGARKPFTCGWSHRWTVGRGMAAGAALLAITAAKVAKIARNVTKPAAKRPPETISGRSRVPRLSDDQRLELERIDADSRAREQPPPD